MNPELVRTVRIVLALLAVFFAHWLGRSAMALWRGQTRRSHTFTWIFRTLAALLGVFWIRRIDLVALATAVCSGLSLALGAYMVAKPRKVESQRLGLMDDDEPPGGPPRRSV